jgi:hypothetical protein
VLEKAAMKLEGTMRDDTWLRGHWRSSHLYSVLDDEWSPGGARSEADPGAARSEADSGGTRNEADSGEAAHEEER